MTHELPIPQLTRTLDAWLVEVPAVRFGSWQRYRFQVESQARRFLALFTRWERRTLNRRGTSQSPA